MPPGLIMSSGSGTSPARPGPSLISGRSPLRTARGQDTAVGVSMANSGGAHMLDVTPQEGWPVVFPAFLPHKAMPCAGEKERIVVSFNVQTRAPGGDQIYRYDST